MFEKSHFLWGGSLFILIAQLASQKLRRTNRLQRKGTQLQFCNSPPFPSHSSYFQIFSTMPIFPDFHNSDHTSMFPYFPNTAHVFRVPQDSPFFYTLIKNEKNASGTASAERIKYVIQALNICCLFLSTKCMQLTISITKRTWLKFQIKSQK